MRKVAFVLLIFMMLGTIATSMATTEVVVNGDSSVGVMADIFAKGFNAQQTQYHVSVNRDTTENGIKAIDEGKADVAMISRNVTADEKIKIGDKFQQTLIGYQGLVISVSASIYDAGVTSLTKDQVKKIYAGDIKNWKELGGPDKDIYVISRENDSGARYVYLKSIFGDSKAETPAVKAYYSNNSKSKEAIARSDRAIGYLDYTDSFGKNLDTVTLNGIEDNTMNVRYSDPFSDNFSINYPLVRPLTWSLWGETPDQGQRLS
jgi:phosphate transport system substrate-binding protein